ncbi:DNA ligase, ATP-dependent, putative [Thiobacillus denitrificans ATCC 25259]|uniref:DNA ligase (ATP) n=1 Tax=Thiobacillus denitrificans (strain ATCC 25259 / T1) TaxID=292415 RepID=Q3SGP7_THIDA|nr:DNA ligase D [Thiobacillus denitrificans]AAZ98200.1 DNA ligase, ATP-dependent, putative [Thiobacillus denitrificans ATCC 25259]
MAKRDPLSTYTEKRDFSISPEPVSGGQANEAARSFVVQKHWATRLHYDFRLELDGSMKSWAVPKGPSLDPADKRMAVHVEDHPIAYNAFEGTIPPRQYGAGKVIIWDKGTWVPLVDPRRGYEEGHLKFELHGHKLQGRWALVRMKGKGEAKEPWLLIKEKDEHARPAADYSVVDALPDSVADKDDAAAVTKAAAPRRRAGETPRPRKARAAKATEKAGAAAVEGAVKSALPATLAPQLATLADKPPDDGDGWVYEVKFDGYRMLARIDKTVRLFTRNGNDWSHRLAPLVKAIEAAGLRPGWLDGEVVVPNAAGVPDFQALQNAFDQARADAIVYYVFDLPFYDGYDLRAAPLVARKALLAGLLDTPHSDALRLSESFDAAPRDILASACKMGLEGVIAKRRDAPYVSRRSTDWLKLKCTRRQEFVIGGYTDPRGSRPGLGSLLLGVHDARGELVYAGNVGTGFDHGTLGDLRKKLAAHARDTSPFVDATGIAGKPHWVDPKLVAEVSFGEWTKSGRIRHAVFEGLRLDKRAASVVREEPVAAAAAAPRLPADLKVSHPERVVDKASGTTKLALIAYYARVAPLMMPHLKARPVSLVRAPDGVGGSLFFQKHVEASQMRGVKTLPRTLDPGHAPLIEVAAAEGLLTAAQMNVIEFHTWNARKTRIDKPDRMTFDLDPGEGVGWTTVQESAHLVREFLSQLGLASFLKTSGGKGLHIVVPLKRLHDWDTVKDFSHAIVRHLARTLPQRFAAKSGPKNRVGKIFIDYLRNGFGATTVAAWSVRARPGLGVSVPLEWRELDALTSAAQWTVPNIDSRLEIGNAPWEAYDASSHSLTRAMKTLGHVPKTPA